MWLPAESINILQLEDEKSVGLDSKEGNFQDDTEPIDLRRLIWGP